MAALGFLFYGLLAYTANFHIQQSREQTYDDFILQFKNGTLIATTFTNEASVCNWALGLLNYKNIQRSLAELLPTKLKNDEHLIYSAWCGFKLK